MKPLPLLFTSLFVTLAGYAATAPAEPDWAAQADRLAACHRAGDQAIQADRLRGADCWRDYLAEIEAAAAKFPEADLTQYADSYLYRVRTSTPTREAEMATLKRFGGSANASIRTLAGKWLQNLAVPFELAFTALDGREVDLKQLRGKVVLVDFWATWCGPCRAEIPSVVALYQRYHQAGFEIVGISLDRPNAREQLVTFLRAHDMPWPQYYDGKYWESDLAVKYGIKVIPAMFLLDQNGMIVSTGARGAKLEQEVRRLLGK